MPMQSPSLLLDVPAFCFISRHDVSLRKEGRDPRRFIQTFNSFLLLGIMSAINLAPAIMFSEALRLAYARLTLVNRTDKGHSLASMWSGYSVSPFRIGIGLDRESLKTQELHWKYI